MTKQKKSNEIMVFGYVRVSTENQLENYSIDEQCQRLEAYCKAKGWTLLNTYIDGGFSGGNTERPQLQAMLHAIRTNNIDAVVVYKLDRLSRSQKDTLTLIEDEFLAHGTDFVSINENFDTSTPFGRAMIGILSVFAQLEKDQITERLLMGREGRTKAGYFHGGGTPPTGYDYIDGNLVVNEYEAAQVRELFSMFINGKSINYITKHHSEAYTTKWSAPKSLNILRNEIYIGKVQFNGMLYDGIHKPLITEEVFNAAQRILKSQERQDAKTNAQKHPFRAGYMLSGLLYCERCGARYSANHGYYRCYSRAKSSKKFIKDPNCKNDHWKIEDLDSLVCSEIKSITSDKSKLRKILENADKQKVVHVDKSAVRKRIEDIEQQISKLVELYQVNAIPMEVVTTKANALSSERSSLEDQLNRENEISAVDMFSKSIEIFQDGFDKADTDGKRALISSLVERISIDGQIVRFHWRV